MGRATTGTVPEQRWARVQCRLSADAATPDGRAAFWRAKGGLLACCPRMVCPRRVPCVLLLLALGCAHEQVGKGAGSEPEPTDDPTTRLSRENATLKRRVQMLEDRVLHLEQRTGAVAMAGPPAGGAAQIPAADQRMTLPDGRQLPVVRLAEPAPPAPAPEMSSSTWHAATAAGTVHADPEPLGDPEPPRRSRLIGTRDAALPLDDEELSGFSAGAPEPELGGETRSFRLVGSRLAELSKTERKPEPDEVPEPAPSPARRKKPRGNKAIIARYEEAMAMLQAGDAGAAELAFAEFVADHPRHDYADNALYWKGEAAYDQQRYADALAAFTSVVERYGGGNKAPDALLKIGLCYDNLGDPHNARDVLSELIAAYPGARASGIARVKLAELSG